MAAVEHWQVSKFARLETKRFHQDPRGFNQTLDVVCIEVILELYVDEFLGCFHTAVFPSKVAG
jgi:hypothetical protein